MEKQDKAIMIGSIVVALILLYMIKPAPVNAFCSDWASELFHKSISLDNKFSSDPSEEVANEWMTMQREDLIYTTACSDLVDLIF